MFVFRKFISPAVKLQKQRYFYCAYSTMLHKEAKVKVDKWDINYLKVGKGPHKVLCLPGALGTIWTDFKPQIEGFDLEKFTLVVWDPPGYGKSRPPEKDFPADFYEKDEAKVKVDKWDINYLKVGKGPHKVLCLPGALGTIWTDFKPQIEGFDLEKFTLVVWDPPGYGKSRPPEKDFPADFYEKDADYAYEFMKALNIPKYSVLGWSDGGSTSFILAAKYPDSITKLVAWGTNSFILPHELEWYKQIRDITSWSEKMREPFVEIYGKEFLAVYWSKWLDGMITVFNSDKGNICAQMLKDIKCPTFILYGERDPLVDPVHASHLLTNITDSRVHLYPKGKHNLHINYAEDFNQRVQEFLLQP